LGLQDGHEVVSDYVGAAGHIHQPCVPFHALEFRCVDDADCLGREGQGEHDEVGVR
jgi:hypothetical protein